MTTTPTPIPGGEILYKTMIASRAALLVDPSAKLMLSSDSLRLIITKELSFGEKQTLIGSGWNTATEGGVSVWILKYTS